MTSNFFVENKGKYLKMNDGGYITDLAFLVDMTDHFNKLNKELHGKDKLSAYMYDNMKVFKIKLRL